MGIARQELARRLEKVRAVLDNAQQIAQDTGAPTVQVEFGHRFCEQAVVALDEAEQVLVPDTETENQFGGNTFEWRQRCEVSR